MKRILYAGADFLTEDAIADALMDYASVLAVVNSADVVELPGIDDEGRVRSLRMIIGPSSQILSMDSDDTSARLNADAAVSLLRERARTRLPDPLDVGDAGTSDNAETEAETDAESTSHQPDSRSR